MRQINQFRIIEQIAETSRSLIYRVQKNDYPQTFILKQLKNIVPAPAEIARFKKEHKIIRHINCEGVINIYDTIIDETGFSLILEDFQGISLAQYLKANGSLEIDLFLKIALRITAILEQIHRKNIIHQDIKPDNILYNEEKDIIKLTDFGISALLPVGTNFIMNQSNTFEGTLLYISPEQTGRMKHAIDFRSDLYSLGITFYQLLTTTTPFMHEDPVEIIHAHIAQQADPPHKRNPQIPLIISNIIMKLMSKNPEDRYQNAYSLMIDLKKCNDTFFTDNKFPLFELGQKDFSKGFKLSKKLFGREKEKNLFRSAYDQINSQSRPKFFLVSGDSGVGKSSLIHDFGQYVSQKRGYFISGNYEQFTRDQPYHGIAQAFRNLFHLILTESDNRIAQLKDDFITDLSPNGKLMVDLIPELELIIGPQPQVPDLPSLKAKNRLHFMFEKFIKVFTKNDMILVIFLDDLQWIDHPSLELLDTFLKITDINSIFFIGTFRKEDIYPSHPLQIFLKNSDQSYYNMISLNITELETQDVQKLITDEFKCSDKKAAPLAELVCKKTKGNPFFIREFLQTLYDENIIKHQAETGWSWDINLIEQTAITDNVVQFLVSRISRLDPKTQKILKYCACFGNSFDSGILSQLINEPEDSLQNGFDQLVEVGFLHFSQNQFVFAHDKIQEVAYSLIPDKDKPEIHYQIGKINLDNTPQEELENKIFLIMDHFNAGSKYISDNEKTILAEYNFQCGYKAKSSAAFTSASSYFKSGIALLKNDSWKEQYKLSLNLYTLGAETEQFTGDYSLMENYISMVLKNAKSIYDKIDVYTIRINTYWSKKRFDESINMAFEVLKELKYPLPRHPGKLQIVGALLRIRPFVTGKSINNLEKLPKMTDPHYSAVIQILSLLGQNAFFVSTDLFTLTVIKETEITLKYGHSKIQTYNYMGMAIILFSAFQDYGSAYKLGKLALRLTKKLEARVYEARNHLTYTVFIRHWCEHLSTSVPELVKTSQIAIETGDLEWMCHSLTLKDGINFFLGKNLPDLQKEVEKSIAIIKKYNPQFELEIAYILLQMILNLRGISDSPLELDGKVLNQDKFLSKWKESHSNNTLANYYASRLVLRYMFGDYIRGLEDSITLEKYRYAITGIANFRTTEFYSALVRLALFNQAGKKQKRRFQKYIKKSIKRFKKWNFFAPMNNEQKLYLLQAEFYRVKNQTKKTEGYLEKAIEAAQKNQYPNDEAIACELAGRFYKEKGKKALSLFHLVNAYRIHARIGVQAKMDALRKAYPEMMSWISDTAISTSRTSSLGYSLTANVDLSSIIKASQLISGEMVLKRLLDKIMKISVENAGAQKGIMIIEKRGRFYVEAQWQIEKQTTEFKNPVPIENHGELSLSVIKYVSRTSKSIILHNAAREGDFIHDPYIKKNEAKSILCIPIINQGKTIGILYLENKLVVGIFNEERLNLLKILSSQIAISLHNAQIYEFLEEKVKERTAQLDEANQKLKELTLKDPLTKLRNRRYIYEYVNDLSKNFIKSFSLISKHHEKRETSLNTVFGIFIIDLDHFKLVNDTYGHQSGDSILVQFSNILKSMIRGDDILVRWGGEEFLIILRNTKKEYLPVFSKHILNTIQNTRFNIKDSETIQKTCSIGAVKMPMDENLPDLLSLEQMINIADYALYRSKESGRNRATHFNIKTSLLNNINKQNMLLSLSKDVDINKDDYQLDTVRPD